MKRNVVSFTVGFSIAVIVILLLCSCTLTGDLKYKTNDSEPTKTRGSFPGPNGSPPYSVAELKCPTCPFRMRGET